jgi:signal transduction histidine kinase/DNA-binding response OmpR family regulator
MARILLVDGNQPARQGVREALGRLTSHEVVEVGEGGAALDRIAREDIDLVVLEPELPGLDGFEVCRRIRADERSSRLPVVFLSATQDQVESRLRGLELGAADFIVQPVADLELCARLGSVLRSKALIDEVRRHTTELEDKVSQHTRQLEELADELRVERDALRETFDVIESGLYLYDGAGVIQIENAAGRKLRKETMTPPAGDAGAGLFFESGERGGEAALERVLERLAREAIEQNETCAASLSRDGRQFDARAYPAAGRRALVYVRDVTEERDSEVRRLQSEKLASIGMLAAGVAHEINNPASFVLANTEALGGLLRLMEDKLRNDLAAARKLGLKELLFEAMAIVQESKEGMARIHRIVRDLHAFSRIDHDPTGSTDVNASVESAITMLRNELRYRAQVERILEATRPVRASSARLGQVFLNLILNAAHALKEGELKRNRIAVRSYDEEDHVVVEVEDNGQGIPPEVLPRIFDSFFTTKPPGLGTGLGLSISREIVRASGGEILAESTPGQGSLFRVRLPISPDALAPAPETPAPMPGRRRRRLLAVDDEVLLLKAYRRMLIDHHDLEMAVGGAEALRMLEEDRGFDVVLCDLQMPEVSGAEVYREVARRWPGLEQRFIIITGGAFSPEARKFLEEGLATCLNKPFQLEEILELIERRAVAASR